MIVGEIDLFILVQLVNFKLLVVVIKEFFGFSQLSQFMDQINFLVEFIYKCCILVFGFGGFICECVGFVVCDIYFFYYGCFCLIEMLEGFNVGLINFLVIYVWVNEYGFIEMLFWKVENGVVLKDGDLIYLFVDWEDEVCVVFGDVVIDDDGWILVDLIFVCYCQDFEKVFFEQVDYVVLLLVQVIFVVMFLIFFLEYDDVNCVLMGFNMQCQVVLLLCFECVLVGIGLEIQVV